MYFFFLFTFFFIRIAIKKTTVSGNAFTRGDAFTTGEIKMLLSFLSNYSFPHFQFHRVISWYILVYFIFLKPLTPLFPLWMFSPTHTVGVKSCRNGQSPYLSPVIFPSAFRVEMPIRLEQLIEMSRQDLGLIFWKGSRCQRHPWEWWPLVGINHLQLLDQCFWGVSAIKEPGVRTNRFTATSSCLLNGEKRRCISGLDVTHHLLQKTAVPPGDEAKMSTIL